MIQQIEEVKIELPRNVEALLRSNSSFSQGLIFGNKEDKEKILLIYPVFTPLDGVKGCLYDVVRNAGRYIFELGGTDKVSIVPFFKISPLVEDYDSLPLEIFFASKRTIEHTLFITERAIQTAYAQGKKIRYFYPEVIEAVNEKKIEYFKNLVSDLEERLYDPEKNPDYPKMFLP